MEVIPKAQVVEVCDGRRAHFRRAPIIGEISRGVYAAGGHGMWGLAHGPVTGRLLAEQITTGKQPEALREFDPLRRTGR